MAVHLVCGAPASGKTAWVASQAKEGDTVIDLDALERATGSRSAASIARKALEDASKTFDGDTWVIRTLGGAQERTEAAERLGADKTFILHTGLDENLRRSKQRGDDDQMSSVIKKWWETFSPLDGEELIEPDMGPVRQGETMSAKFPENTPVAEMTTEEQVAYWKHQSRKHEGRVREMTEESTRLAEQIESLGGLEKIQEAVSVDPEELTLRVRSEVLGETVPATVRALFKAEARSTPEKVLEAYLEDIDPFTYMDDDGSVDVEAITERAKVLNEGYSSNGPNHSGYHHTPPASGVAAGASMYENDK